MMKRKFVIDCDTGTDDAQAILMALAQEDVEVLAVTTVFGNSHLHFTCFNTLRVLGVAGRLDIPVYKGCSRSLLGVPSFADGFHGKDGMGDYTGDSPPDKALIQKEHAANALLRLVNQYPGEITLVVTGPLTNLAVALALDEEFGKKLNHCYIMGGNSQGRGNVKIAQEFNFFSDQEAAQVVLNNLGCPITMIPLELCTEFALPWDVYDKYSSQPTDLGRFVKAIDFDMNEREKKKGTELYYAMWDQLAMAVALDNRVAMESTSVYATVELHGGLTRGQVVVDWLGKLGQEPNVNIVRKVDKDLFLKLLYRGIGVDIKSVN